MNLFPSNYLLVLSFVVLAAACKKEDNAKPALQNDVLKKTTGPAIVGDRVEFVYALGTTEGRLQNATADASIAGATGTGFGRYSYYTDRNTGIDMPVLTLKDSSTKGSASTGSFVDTNAVSLRYYYVVPEEARGKTVSFRFSGTSTTGGQTSISTRAYQMSRMDMKRSIALADGARCYASIADMAAYTKDEVTTGNLSSKIDFVYIYRATMGAGNYAFGHALVGLANTQYITDLALPASWTKPATFLDKRIDVRDGQLKGDVNTNIYLDDTDLQRTGFTNAANYTYGLAADQGAFVKTSNGTVAYVYVNSIDNTRKTATVSIKRLKP